MKVGLPEVLKYLRKDCNLTQRQLAEETGLSLSAIVSYENGLREPNSKAMAVLERYFNVSGEYLRGELPKEKFFSKHENTIKELDNLSVLFSSFGDAMHFGSQDKQVFCAQILGETIQFLTKSILPDEKEITFSSEQFESLLSSLTLLNKDGQDELIKRSAELTQIEMYKYSN